MVTGTAVSSATDAKEANTAYRIVEQKRKRSHQLSLPETAAVFSLPLLPYKPGQTIRQYFETLSASLDVQAFRRVARSELSEDGLYLHKRPINRLNSNNKGTVSHHVVLYVKEGEQLHSLDFGPDNGADVTDNIFLEYPSRKVLSLNTQIPAMDLLALMYVGRLELPLHYAIVKKALDFAEANMYHAMKNNCIHFADFAVRVLTRGKVRSAPLIYDIVCGEVPAQDPPESLMLAMFGLSWFTVCDGSPLTARFMASLDQPLLQHSNSLTDLPSKKPEIPNLPIEKQSTLGLPAKKQAAARGSSSRAAISQFADTASMQASNSSASTATNQDTDEARGNGAKEEEEADSGSVPDAQASSTSQVSLQQHDISTRNGMSATNEQVSKPVSNSVGDSAVVKADDRDAACPADSPVSTGTCQKSCE